MEYKDLLKSHERFGTTESNLINKKNYNNILKNVVIAPSWKNNMFDILNYKVEQISDKIYNFYGDKISFSFIEVSNIGASAVMEYIIPLGLTKCENILFVGSTGSLDENIHIGDLVIPEYSVCGDGSSRYLNDNLEDELFKKEYPSKDITNKLINILKDDSINYHYVPNYSIDSIVAQFLHIDKIMSLGAKTIEMETANLFKCNELLKRNVTALFCVSDSTVINKSVYSGRTEKDKEIRHKTRFEIMPKIIVKLFEEMED